MSTIPDRSSATQPRTAVAPLLDLLRTVLHQRGEITLRLDDRHPETGWICPADNLIGLADVQDDREYLITLVHVLHQLMHGGAPMTEATSWFVHDAAARTLAKMGVRATLAEAGGL